MRGAAELTRASDDDARPDAAGPPLEARALVRDYGPVRAVSGVTFSLEAGRLLAVFGPNGAGKTTLLKLLSGGLRPTRGEVRVRGRVLGSGEIEVRRAIGVLSHQTFLYRRLTAAENLRFYADLYGLPEPAEKVAEGLESVGLLPWSDREVRELSRGMRQRLALARTLLHDPEIVLLDEPYTGLDPHAAALLRATLGRLRDGRRTVVLVTHNLSQGLELADEVAIQVRGRFVHHAPREGTGVEAFERFYRETVEGTP